MFCNDVITVAVYEVENEEKKPPNEKIANKGKNLPVHHTMVHYKHSTSFNKIRKTSFLALYQAL